jgi:hypothetical protein
MYDISKMNDLRDKSAEAIERLEGIAEGLKKKIEKIRADSSRSAEWIQEEIKKEREKILPEVPPLEEKIRAIAEEIRTQKKYWESVPMVLSAQSSDSDKASEFGQMPLNLFSLAIDNARAEENFSILYQLWLSGNQRIQEPGFSEVMKGSLDGLKIQDQGKALADVAFCENNQSQAHFINLVEINGLSESPTEKMNRGRQQTESDRLVSEANNS